MLEEEFVLEDEEVVIEEVVALEEVILDEEVTELLSELLLTEGSGGHPTGTSPQPTCGSIWQR